MRASVPRSSRSCIVASANTATEARQRGTAPFGRVSIALPEGELACLPFRSILLICAPVSLVLNDRPRSSGGQWTPKELGQAVGTLRVPHFHLCLPKDIGTMCGTVQASIFLASSFFCSQAESTPALVVDWRSRVETHRHYPKGCFANANR